MASGPAPWAPTTRDGRVRIGLGGAQRRRWAALTAAVTGAAGAAGVLAGRPALVAAAALLAGASLAYAFVVRIEVTATDLAVVAPSLRRRWRRTLSWTAVADIRTTGTGEIWLAVPGEPPLVLPAPRGRWLGTDPHLDEKLRLVHACWQAAVAAAARQTTRTPLDRLRAVIDTWEHRGAVPPEDTGPAPGLRLPAEGAAPAERAPFPFLAMVGFVLLALAVGYLLIGRDVIVVAVALLVLLRFGRDPGRPLALGAVALLVVAGASTVLQARSAPLTLAYAAQRTVAVEAGALLGVLLVVSTLIFAVTERAAARATVRGPGASLDRVHLAAVRAVLPPWLRAAVPYVLVALAGVAIRVAGAPAPLSPVYQPLLVNLRLGTGYSLAPPSGGTPYGELPPLAPVLVAYSPLGPRAALLGVSTLTVVAVGVVAHRRWGRAAGIMAAAVAAVLPSLWGDQLPVQLAALAVLAGFALADPPELTTRRAALAGAALGLAALARPDAALALPAVALWVSRRRERPQGLLTALVVAFVAVILPWANYVWREFGSPWLTSSLPATLNDPTAVSRLPSTTKVAVSAAFLAVFLVAAVRLWHQREVLLPVFALPVVTAALAVTEPLRRDPIGWSAPLAAVLLGRWAATVVRAQLGPVLEVRYRDVVDWDVVLADQQRRRGVRVGEWATEDETPFEPGPEEDRLFL